MNTAAASLAEMGTSINLGNGGGFNPTSMMTGIAVGGALGNQMAGMINQMGQNVNQSMQQNIQSPPPFPQISYFMHINGQQMGPYNIEQLQMFVQSGQLTLDTYVWKQGMAQWDIARNTELVNLFSTGSNVTPPSLPPNIQ